MRKMERYLRECPTWAMILIGVMVLFTCGFVTSLVGVDYEAHNEIALMLKFRDPIGTFRDHPEPLWHIFVAVIVKLTHIRVEFAAGIVTAAFVLFSFFLTYFAIRKAVPDVEGSVVAFFCIILHIVIAIYVPWFNKEPYIGQGSPNIWHNCTSIAIRPIALLVVLLVIKEIEQCRASDFNRNVSVPRGIGIAILLVLSCLAKPAFVQIFYPSIFTLMVVWLIMYNGRSLRMGLQLVLVCLPSLLLTILQFVLAFYGTNKHAGGVTIAPFLVAGMRTPNIPLSMLLALAFPLMMLVLSIVYKKCGWLEIFAWIHLIWGSVWRLLLAEKGDRAPHGNFTWGYILALYLVWFVAIRSFVQIFYDRQEEEQKGQFPLFIIAGILLALHFISGIYYLIYLVFLGNGM